MMLFEVYIESIASFTAARSDSWVLSIFTVSSFEFGRSS